jgi:adenylate cyclase
MAEEIERKFLVKGDQWKAGAKAVAIKQGYIFTAERKSVRVRVKGDQGYITIKAAKSGFTAAEFEYEIPLADAEELLLNICEQPVLDKIRYLVAHQGLTWEVDVFGGANEGLIVAEIELQSEDQSFARPDWIDQEVTGDDRYFNSRLSKRPFRSW